MQSNPNQIDIKSPTKNDVYFTYETVNLPRVKGCNHRIDLHRLPRYRNCDHCWFAFWQNNGKAAQTADEMWQSETPWMLEQIIGTKAVKKFLAFMSTVANMKE